MLENDTGGKLVAGLERRHDGLINPITEISVVGSSSVDQLRIRGADFDCYTDRYGRSKQLYMEAISAMSAHVPVVSEARELSTMLVAITSRLQQVSFGIEAIAILELVVLLCVAQIEKPGTESGGVLAWGADFRGK